MENERELGKRVLVVDDNRTFREAMKMALEADSCTVVEANNGVEALSLFRTSQFDLVMLDLELPFMRGDELAMCIRQLAPEQPIMMVTGYAAKAGPHCPVDAVLRKPAGLREIREALMGLLPQTENEEALVAA